MIVAVRQWYSGLSPREQRLIVAMLLVALPVLAWLLLVRPISIAYDAALTRHLESVDRRGRIAALVDLTKLQPRTTAATGGDLVLLLSDQSRQAGLTIDIQPGATAGTARLSAASVPASAMAAWLTRLEAAGYVLDQLRFTPKGDDTVAVEATVKGAAQ